MPNPRFVTQARVLEGGRKKKVALSPEEQAEEIRQAGQNARAIPGDGSCCVIPLGSI